MIKRIHHVAIVVEDIQAVLGFWGEALGLELTHTEEVSEQQAKIACFPTGESEIELVEPTSDTSGMARYLAKRGPGIHHICFEVDNLTEVLSVLKAQGIRLIDETPRTGGGGKQIAFIHPESTHGVLVELCELAAS
jgi:methylmalonyl-CoA/ethylmalonyl-CoA epimerase